MEIGVGRIVASVDVVGLQRALMHGFDKVIKCGLMRFYWADEKYFEDEVGKMDINIWSRQFGEENEIRVQFEFL